jgi:hypothetical protein
VYTRGSGIRARRKRWFLAVAGSRTGHPLWGEVHGGMTLVAFTCRGRPAAMSRATLRRYGSRWDGSSLRGTFRRAILRRLAPALLSVIERLCVTPFAVPPAVPLLLGFGTCQGNSRAASPAYGNSQPALRASLRRRKERGSGRHLKMAVLVPARYPSTAAGIWKPAPPIASCSGTAYSAQSPGSIKAHQEFSPGLRSRG